MVYVDLNYDEDEEAELAEYTKDMEQILQLTQVHEPYITKDLKKA